VRPNNGSIDPTRYKIVQEVVRDPQSKSSSVMFSSTYKFSYPPGVSAERFPSASTPEHSQATVSIVDPDPPLDYALDAVLSVDRIDPSSYPDIVNCEHPSSFYSFDSFETEQGWALSPSTSGSDDGDYRRSQSREYDDDSLLSPMSACFPSDLSNYASP